MTSSRMRVSRSGSATTAPRPATGDFAQHDETSVRGEVAASCATVSDFLAMGDRPGRNGVALCWAAAKSELSASNVGSVHLDRVANGGDQRNKNAMRFDVSCAIQTPEQLIPSLVWHEPLEERSDFRGNVNQFAVHLVVDESGVIRKREPGAVGGSPWSQRDVLA